MIRKRITAIASALGLAILATGCVTRVVYTPAPPAPPPPPADAQVAPAPAPVVTYAPDYYVWDGYEYVGVYGDQYVYWNGGAWIVCDPVVLGHFHGWVRYHPDWRSHAYHHYYRGHRPYRW